MFNIEKIPGIASIYGVPWTSRLLGLILAGLFGSVFLGVTRFLGVQGLYVSVGLFFTGAAFGYIAWMLSCRIPRNKPGMIGIALAIKTETQEEQRRIRADFIQEIGRCLGKTNPLIPSTSMKSQGISLLISMTLKEQENSLVNPVVTSYYGAASELEASQKSRLIA
ncbi:MAG: hypothetical protein IPH54_19580 [Rhodoferax sp.]|nr:hypothetical protein [Rhodoferax sp.]